METPIIANVLEGKCGHVTVIYLPTYNEADQVGPGNVRPFNIHTIGKTKRKRSYGYQSSVLEVKRKNFNIGKTE